MPVFATGFLSVPSEVLRSGQDFSTRLGKRFALLHGQDGGQFIDIADDEIVEGAQGKRALSGCHVAPGRPGFFRRADGLLNILGVEERDRAYLALIKGVGDLKGGAVGSPHPFAVHQASLFEQI